MNYRVLGRTGLRVSEVSLGTAEIGMRYGLGADHQPDERESARLLHRALDLGVNLLDTARAYGESEAIIGRTLQGRRREFILVSKVQSASRDEMIRSVQESLRQLRTDTVDVMMLHSAPKDVIEAGKAASVLADLRRKGLIRFTGASVYGNEAAGAAIESDAFDCLQIAHNVLDRRPEGAQKRHVGIVARSVVLKGALTGRRQFLPESLIVLREAVEEMEAVALSAEVSLPELAYRYVLQANVADTALVGASSIEELQQAVAFAAAGPLADEVVDQIRRSSKVDDFYLNPGNWPPC